MRDGDFCMSCTKREVNWRIIIKRLLHYPAAHSSEVYSRSMDVFIVNKLSDHSHMSRTPQSGGNSRSGRLLSMSTWYGDAR